MLFRSKDADIVYAVTKEVFENLSMFKTLHEAYHSLTTEQMLEGLTAPLHVGALRYFQEAGMMNKIDKRLIPEEWKVN